MINRFEKEMELITQKGNLRNLSCQKRDGKYIYIGQKALLNLSSNDYLGLGSDLSLRTEFLDNLNEHSFIPSSTSSRLLTGNYPIYSETELLLSSMFGNRAALLFNSGYHANIGILPTVTTQQSLIVADKLVHASLIDGMRLSLAEKVRYRHNDYAQLRQIIERKHSCHDLIVIVTESLFSMDGDYADLRQLIDIKRRYTNVMLYVDEAHAFGVRGEKGLGCAEECHCIPDIDFLVGTFGKAIASMGAFVICNDIVKRFLVNTARPLIFSTALPPFNMAWTHFILSRLAGMEKKRQALQKLTNAMNERYGLKIESPIFPFICGESQKAVSLAHYLQELGYYALAVRPPTVPEGSSRLRMSLTANVTLADLDPLLKHLITIK